MPENSQPPSRVQKASIRSPAPTRASRTNASRWSRRSLKAISPSGLTVVGGPVLCKPSAKITQSLPQLGCATRDTRSPACLMKTHRTVWIQSQRAATEAGMALQQGLQRSPGQGGRVIQRDTDAWQPRWVTGSKGAWQPPPGMQPSARTRLVPSPPQHSAPPPAGVCGDWSESRGDMGIRGDTGSRDPQGPAIPLSHPQYRADDVAKTDGLCGSPEKKLADVGITGEGCVTGGVRWSVTPHTLLAPSRIM